METCVTLGMLAEARPNCSSTGLDYYNHNLDTSPEFYGKIIPPGPPGYAGARARRRHQCLLRRRHRGHGRVAPRARRADRPARQHGALPESVPINNLVQVEGARHWPASKRWIRSNSCASPSPGSPCPSQGRLSAGREQMDDALQALCFMAGANSMFYGDALLTTANPQMQADQRLLARHAHRRRARARGAGVSLTPGLLYLAASIACSVTVAAMLAGARLAHRRAPGHRGELRGRRDLVLGPCCDRRPTRCSRRARPG